MKQLYLWADYIFEAKATVLVLILLLSLTSFINLSIESKQKQFEKYLYRSEQMQLNGRYFYQLGYRPEASYTDNEELIEALTNSKSIKDVTCLNYFSGVGADSKEGELNSLFAIYNLCDSHVDNNKILSVRDYKGKLINYLEPNHVLLDESARTKYKIGDHFSLCIEYISTSPDIHVEEAFIDVEIDGFIRQDENVIYTGHQLTDLSRIYTTVYDPSHPIESMVIDGYPTYYCVCSVLVTNGRVINYNELVPQLLIIKTNDGINHTELFNELSKCGLDPQKIVSYEKLKDNYCKKHEDEVRVLSIYAVSSTILTICVVLCIFIDWYVNKRNELAIFVFCGCQWKNSILLSVSPYYFSIIVGVCFGSLFFTWYKKQIANELNNLTIVNELILLTTYLCIYSLAVFIYYSVFKRYSPVELYRTKE